MDNKVIFHSLTVDEFIMIFINFPKVLSVIKSIVTNPIINDIYFY